MKENKISRRGFAKTAITGIIGGLIGAGVGYGAAGMTKPEGVPGETATVTKTVAGAGEAAAFPFNLPRGGATVAERAVNSAKAVLEMHPEYKGKELVLTCVGGQEHGFIAMKRIWETLIDVPVAIPTIPFADFFDKMMKEAVTKTGDFDLLNAQAMYFSDLAAAGLFMELDDVAMWIDIREHGRPDGMIYPLNATISRYKGTLYGYLQDGDVQMLYYRFDFLEDPTEMTNFERQYGYPLKVPETFAEYRDMNEFWWRPPDMSGSSSGAQLERAAITYYLFPAAMKWPNWYYFDDDMNAQLTSPEALEAGDLFAEIQTYGFPEQLEMVGQAPYSIFAEGKAAFILSAPSTGRVIQDPAAASRNNWEAAPIPGWMVETPDGKTILNRRSVNLASWSLGVNAHSKMPELAACFGAFCCDSDMLIEAMKEAGTWHDPSRYTHVGPNAPASLIDLRGPVIMAFEKNATVMQPMLQGVLGATEYSTGLSKNLHAALSGALEMSETLEVANEQWEEITDRLGRENQLEAWLALKEYYPTTTV